MRIEKDGKSEEKSWVPDKKSRAIYDSALGNDLLVDVIFARPSECQDSFLIFQAPIRQFVQAPVLMNSLNILSLSSGVSL